MIVIEGMDNSGKSTLAKAIAKSIQYDIKESEGPPQGVEEFNARVARYNLLRKTVVVRHPVISEKVYGILRGSPIEIEAKLISEFWARRPLFVYCDPLNRRLQGHLIKSHDNSSHLTAINDRYGELVNRYREWALTQAHIFYRIGDDIDRIIRTVKGGHFY